MNPYLVDFRINIENLEVKFAQKLHTAVRTYALFLIPNYVSMYRASTYCCQVVRTITTSYQALHTNDWVDSPKV